VCTCPVIMSQICRIITGEYTAMPTYWTYRTKCARA
jgi:hypothetical protein